jgi:hypothetical protein
MNSQQHHPDSDSGGTSLTFCVLFFAVKIRWRGYVGSKGTMMDMVSREGRVNEVGLNGMVIERVKGGKTLAA